VLILDTLAEAKKGKPLFDESSKEPTFGDQARLCDYYEELGSKDNFQQTLKIATEKEALCEANKHLQNVASSEI
jgi:hypothetical protein